jgi:hypothetical protein
MVKGVQEVENKKKFILELDEVPALVFVSKEGIGRHDELYVKGEKVSGTKSVRIVSDLEEFTTHEVEYITFCFSELNNK